MKKALLTFAVACLTLCTCRAAETITNNHQFAREFMRNKLVCSSGIVEGLALENFKLVATNATLLRSMNLTNAYMLLSNPYYTKKIAKFQATVDSLKKAAEKQDLWGAYDQYNKVTRCCVDCHQMFRREQFQTAQKRPELFKD